MRVDPVARSLLDRLGDGTNPDVADVDGALTHRTDQMVVMVRRVARHVGVAAANQVNALYQAQRLEDLERAKYRGSAHPWLGAVCLANQIVGREPALVRCDDLSHGAPWLGDLVSGPIESLQNGGGITHGGDDTESQTWCQGTTKLASRRSTMPRARAGPRVGSIVIATASIRGQR